MKLLWVNLTLMVLLLVGCGKTANVPDLSAVKPGEKVTLSEGLGADVIPQFVVPYGRSPALAFSNLEFTEQEGTIRGKVDFVRKGQDDFTLVAYLNMPDELLVGYLGAESNLNIHLPSGTVLFGSSGYRLAGEETGSIEFSLSGKSFNGYNVSGEKGTVYVFAVPGTVNPRSTLPGDQQDIETYQANSNVLTKEFRF